MNFIIQDKASCFTVAALSNAQGDAIDACAAPGNKTIQLAQKIWPRKVYAYERDAERFQVLKKRVLSAGAINVIPTQGDFLQVQKFPSSVRTVIVDPS